jgi:phenylacetate-coenzyme A ligase PaaK-like adenylate-forming protein
MNSGSIFEIQSDSAFQQIALKTYEYQYFNMPVYREFCDLLSKNPSQVSQLKDIPFLPIEFFKTHKVCHPERNEEAIFTSSGTTGIQLSKHYISDIALYRSSFRAGFKEFYGKASDFCILALLPSYQERPGSSLIYMVEDLIQASKENGSCFLNGDNFTISHYIEACDSGQKPVLLIGVSFALLDLAIEFPMKLKNTIIMETGGMKGRRKELVREELHHTLRKGFGVEKIHSEYGMTELLSQAYSSGNGCFYTPPWMRILLRDTEDPLSYVGHEKTGGINIIDLANRNSCSFIATQDLGKTHANGSFEVLGRFDHSDIRGCNLMAL